MTAKRTPSHKKTARAAIKVADLPVFDGAASLENEQTIAAYLTDILEAQAPALLAAALGDIARAHGMTEIAKASGITREALYKALRPDAQPPSVGSVLPWESASWQSPRSDLGCRERVPRPLCSYEVHQSLEGSCVLRIERAPYGHRS